MASAEAYPSEAATSCSTPTLWLSQLGLEGYAQLLEFGRSGHALKDTPNLFLFTPWIYDGSEPWTLQQ